MCINLCFHSNLVGEEAKEQRHIIVAVFRLPPRQAAPGGHLRAYVMWIESYVSEDTVSNIQREALSKLSALRVPTKRRSGIYRHLYVLFVQYGDETVGTIDLPLTWNEHQPYPKLGEQILLAHGWACQSQCRL